MKLGFVLTAQGHVASALVSKGSADVFTVGDRVAISRTLHIAPDIVINAGEQGSVDFINEETGWVEILLDVYHKGLAGWDNHLWLEPFGTEDIIGGIIHCGSALVSILAA